jgi:hypothetical protein
VIRGFDDQEPTVLPGAVIRGDGGGEVILREAANVQDNVTIAKTPSASSRRFPWPRSFVALPELKAINVNYKLTYMTYHGMYY